MTLADRSVDFHHKKEAQSVSIVQKPSVSNIDWWCTEYIVAKVTIQQETKTVG